MKIVRSAIVVAVALFCAVPSSSYAKNKKESDKGILESMEAVPCGTQQKGVAGLGTFWASVGLTHVNSNEKLCPQYLLRTDTMDYQIRPVDMKHLAIVTVGEESEYKIKNNHIYVKGVESDRKTRVYTVVAMKRTDTDTGSAESSSARK